MQRHPVTLQINLAPRDFRFARYMLAHQIRQWGCQVDEILLVIESRRSRGVFGADWDAGMKAILALAHSFPKARVVSVDYSRAAQRRVAAEFFSNRRVIPAKDSRGGPYYSYFFGLATAANNFVLHLDSDLFCGGGSPTWLAEATGLFLDFPDLLFVMPLSGPLAASGKIGDSHDPKVGALRETVHGPARVHHGMSTRAFLMDRARFREKLAPLPVDSIVPGRPLTALIRRLRGRSNADAPEQAISRLMRERHLVRLDYLGASPGMWSLHPPVPALPAFQEALPRLVSRVENDDIPDGQRGYYDMNESMLDQ